MTPQDFYVTIILIVEDLSFSHLNNCIPWSICLNICGISDLWCDQSSRSKYQFLPWHLLEREYQGKEAETKGASNLLSCPTDNMNSKCIVKI
jgi:hypothetical protein